MVIDGPKLRAEMLPAADLFDRPHFENGFRKLIAKDAMLGAVDLQQPTKCVICLNEIPLKGMCVLAVMSKCNHFLHMHCAARWYSEQHTCPICQAEVSELYQGGVWVDNIDWQILQEGSDNYCFHEDFHVKVSGENWNFIHTVFSA